MALPAYDQCIKASHAFNLLDARGVISVTERQSYILRVRELAKACGAAWLKTAGGGAEGLLRGAGEGGRRPDEVWADAAPFPGWTSRRRESSAMVPPFRTPSGLRPPSPRAEKGHASQSR